MSKYTCFVVWAVSLSCVCAGEAEKNANNMEAMREDCFKEFGTTEAEFMEATETADVSKINPCFFGCYCKKIGLLNDKGQYDPSIYLKDLRETMKDDSIYAKLKEETEKCKYVKDEAVSDGEAGCEMGALVAACFIKEEQLFNSNNAQN